MYCLLKKNFRYEGTARYPETPKPGKKKRSQKHKRKVKNPYMKFKEKQRRHGESPMPKVVSLSPSPKPQIVSKSLSPKFDQPQVVSLSPKLPVYYENWYDKKNWEKIFIYLKINLWNNTVWWHSIRYNCTFLLKLKQALSLKSFIFLLAFQIYYLVLHKIIIKFENWILELILRLSGKQIGLGFSYNYVQWKFFLSSFLDKFQNSKNNCNFFLL